MRLLSKVGMSRTIRLSLCGLMMLLSVSVLQAAAPKGPLQVMVHLSGQVNQQLKQKFVPNQNNRALFEHLVDQYIMPVLDVDGLSAAVVGRRYWSQATSSQKKKFILYFKQSVVKTYVSAFDSYKGHKIYFRRYDPVPRSRYALIRSIIVFPDGRHFNINYTMVLIGKQWKVHNINVGGIDMISTYRLQFAPILKESGLDGLIKALKKKLQHD